MLYKKIGMTTCLDMLSNFFYGPPKGSAHFSPVVEHEKIKISSICLCDTLLERSWCQDFKKIIFDQIRPPPKGSVHFNEEKGAKKDEIELCSICMCNTLFESS